MAELTIQIPDELAQRLEPLQNRLPELLWRLLDIDNLQTISQPTIQADTIDIAAVYQEVLDFLIKRPTPEEIITFKVSPQSQTRLQQLLEKNRSATLSALELAELDVYEQLEHMMILLKARAYSEVNK
jgi:predicted transcriptional regulator